jgi:hypothetical protein
MFEKKPYARKRCNGDNKICEADKGIRYYESVRGGGVKETEM